MIVKIGNEGGVIVWTVRDGRGVAVATSRGDLYFSGNVTPQLRALGGAIAEWSLADQNDFDGENERKLLASIRPRP